MFRQLHETFTGSGTGSGTTGSGTTGSSPQAELNQNIARYQSVEPNFVVFNSQNGYSFPNAGITANELQTTNTNLTTALNNLGSIPNFSADNKIDTSITNIGAVLTGIPDDIGRNAQSCRQFTGLSGLSQMSGSINTSAPERCGWRYKPGAGMVPEVAQGAFGNASGPLDPATPKKDAVGNGIQYYWNLKDAEKAMVKDVCKAATHCQDMSILPGNMASDFKKHCAFCTTSKKMIPVKTVNGRAMPRYDDVDLQCSSENLITSDNTGKCPPPEPGAPESELTKCLNPGKLDRDCIALSAVYAGCGTGSLMNALKEGGDQTDYVNKLRQKKSYQTYQQLAKPILSDEVLRSGNATLLAAWANISHVNSNQYIQNNEKLRVAATDLCRSPGLYDTYNFCDDLQDSSREYDVVCMQKEFLRQGGTTLGISYPTQKVDMTWGAYKASVSAIATASRGADPETQRSALNELTGLGIQKIPTGLPRASENQGVEIFWFDYKSGTLMGRRPTLSASGSNLPFFNVAGAEVSETNINDQVGFIAFADLRPATSMNIRFGVVTDDGYGVAINQDFFAAPSIDPSKRFAWWYDQGPTWHETPAIPLNGDSEKTPNILTVAWYENGGGAVSQSYFMGGAVTTWAPIGDKGVNPTWKDMCYFTQEINAPSLSFEVYTRKNQTVFCEKRFWSHYLPSSADSGVRYSKAEIVPSQMTLLNKKWTLGNKIAYSAFNTITLCFRIDSVNSSGNKAQPIFTWGSIQVFVTKASDSVSSISLRIGSFSSPSYQIKNDGWYMAVLTWNRVSNFNKNIKSCNFFVQSIANMKAGNILKDISVYTTPTGGDENFVLFNDYKTNRSTTAPIVLGSAALSCRIAWLHFFDRQWFPTDTDLFKIETAGTWKGRWFE